MSISTLCAKNSYLDKNTTAAIGQNVTLECGIYGNCPYFTWFIYLANTSRIDLLIDQCTNSYRACHATADNGRNVLRLTDIDNRVAGHYQCLCATNPSPYAFACERLIVVCQFEVRVNNVLMFNSSSIGPTHTHVINVTEGEYIRVKCPKNSNRHNCSEGSSKKFNATRSHQNCYIECKCSRIGATWVTINVLQRETTTTSTATTAAVHFITSTTSLASYSKEPMKDGKTHYPVSAGIGMSSNDNYITIVIALVIVAILLLMVAVGLCVYLRSSKTKRKSNSDTKNKSIFPHSTYAAAPTYAMIDKENNGNTTAGIDVAELKETTTSDALESDVDYSAVNPKPGHAEEKNVKTTMSNISPKKENKNSMNYETVNELQSKLPKSNKDTLNKDDYDTDNIQSSEINSDVDASKFVHIPEYAEVNHHTTNDDDVSVLYATVDKTR
ncbi:hypothetical protein BSL78_22950 [Apostichopus japonicus]|uniref:Ig-like domain-containing protein n=2 Tax=Stichopus japonicus TaxID=307972 RepID=A0A2G8JWT7_STIJA|nr:hypothetical protein BSL78_22950 [Apostichopus japonicus]